VKVGLCESIILCKTSFDLRERKLKMKIAMWSGPRNLSTAMMYSFGNRADFHALDEPFYAAYLAKTGVMHPMGEDILTAQETNPNDVPAAFTIAGDRHLYMKHMAHHMLPDFPLDWAKDCVNIHLLRHPSRVIASYDVKRAKLTADDIGFSQQLALYEKLGGLVIDSTDIRADPDRALKKLCAEIGLEFDGAMLLWPEGSRDFDGIWAKHWYGAVHRSTGFVGAEGPLPEVRNEHQGVLDEVTPIFETLAQHVTRL
jgi:hypothetical protein